MMMEEGVVTVSLYSECSYQHTGHASIASTHLQQQSQHTITPHASSKGCHKKERQRAHSPVEESSDKQTR